ncbi:MAG TPA: glycosyltransferase family 39 protein [Pyrinomonadaceae bacterium]|nr:glycosyltransferase family 39 protein [Pyrinomonadaceae bacterium]
MNPAANISLVKASRPALERIWPLSAVGLFLPSVFFLAFAARLGVRLYFGEEYFWRNSYSLFYQIAERLAAVHELSYEWLGTKYAHRPPVYPALLAATTVIFGKSYIAIVVLQSLIGAGTVLCAYFIGKELFNKNVGRLAAIGVAFYPYFVMHDTALQETGVFTFLTALSILLLLKSRQSNTIAAAAGVALGLAILTRATLIGFVPLALLWVLWLSDRVGGQVLKRTAAVSIGLMFVITPWLVRNYVRIGTPTISTLSGLTLWAGNNPHTFSNYPNQSIDRSVNTAWRELSPEEDAAIQQLSIDEVRQNAWFIDKALDYIRQHPQETAVRAFRKVAAGFSWTLNPRRERFVQVVYFLSYVPVLLMAIAGAWLARRRWRDYGLIAGLFLSFIIVTAIFFAHTSHRVFLDVYLIIFAAYAFHRIVQRYGGRGEAACESLNA